MARTQAGNNSPLATARNRALLTRRACAANTPACLRAVRFENGTKTVAYHIRAEEIIGGPEWMETESYDMNAKAEKSSNIEGFT